MAKCPSCKHGYCYFPFYGPPECVNSGCKFFSNKHFLAMKEEMEKCPTEPAPKQFSLFADDDGDADLSSYGWTPYIGGLFGGYRTMTSGSNSKPPAVDPSSLSYDQAVSASIARSKKP